MPLDRIKARQRVEGARNAYRVGIRADFIQLLANDLDEALTALDQVSLDTTRARNDVSRMERELDEEKTAYRKLREQSAHMEAVTALLREIAKSPKGAAKKAEEMLGAMGIAAAPAPVVQQQAGKVVVP